ncbi:MAG: phosphatidate cytidylyltransferase [Burkholderiales bacterium]|nr:phosphatidate cytidylyltransferase [Burkholderiales bacterium]
MLIHRTMTALVLFFITCFLLFGIPGIFRMPDMVFVSMSWLLCIAAVFELTKMYKFNLIWQIGLLAIITGLLMVLYFIPYDASQIIRIVSILTWCLIVPVILFKQPQNIPKAVICGLAIIIFVPAFYSIVVLQGLFGSLQLISILAIAWVADTGAYFVGRKFGRHKLIPSISPNKTIEGAIGSVVFVIIYLLILKSLNITVYLPTYFAVFKFAIILTIVSILGDLMESWFKRIAKVKDSGNWLPGHGGIFDRIDSLIAVLAVAFAMIRGLI